MSYPPTPKTRFSLKRTATLSVFYCCHGGESCYRRPFQHILGLNLYLESGANPRVAAARSMDSRQQLAGLPTHKQLLSFTLYFNFGSIRFWQDLQSTAMVPLIVLYVFHGQHRKPLFVGWPLWSLIQAKSVCRYV